MTNTQGNRGWAAVMFVAMVMMLAAIAAPAREQAPGQPASGAIFTTLFEFDNSNGDGPVGTPVQGTDGNFYGTTKEGGTQKQGTVFKITPQGELTTLHSFDGPDGNGPSAALVLGTDGNFYGTTSLGGAHTDGCFTTTCGTVFKITPEGALTTLYSFCAQPVCADGTGPSGLAEGSDGNFYGTTEYGGSGSCTYTCGTVFKITPTGVLTTLYSFTSGAGHNPSDFGGLVQGTDGNFYSTTLAGGIVTALCGLNGCGTVFKITPEGTLRTLHNFTSKDGEGAGPEGTLIQATDGNFYGTTTVGGSSPNCPDGCGTVFKITAEGTFTTTARLSPSDGNSPLGLVQGTDGNFYGTTEVGGFSCSCGAVFQVTPEGVVTLLHSFHNNAGGFFASSGLLQATNGTFYGDTFYSFPGDGIIYSLSVGLGPFVKLVPATGKAGATVKILGNNLLFASGVAFNGVAAVFTAESSTYIEATVPAGATTGPIEVTLPNGVLTSNVNFQVLP
jgi:uncharacterized repeat protein (TIGR03803 family)